MSLASRLADFVAAVGAQLKARVRLDQSNVTTSATALAGTETVVVLQAGVAKKSTVQKMLDLIFGQANTWSAKQTFSDGIETSDIRAVSIGFLTSESGDVTQLTNKSAAVTINKLSGSITMHSASLAAGAVVGFKCSNSLVNHTDVVLISISAETNTTEIAYNVWSATLLETSAGFNVYVKNISAGALAEPLKLNFKVIK